MKEIDESQVLFKNLLEIATGELSPTIKDTAQRACDFLRMSDMSVGIDTENLSLVYTLRGRPVATTLGRFLGRVVGIGDDREKEKNHIVQVVTQQIMQQSCDFNIVTGQGIVEAYDEAWGEGTCMTKKPRITRFYQEFPQQVSLLKFESQRGFQDSAKKVRARALIWKTTTGVTAVDRIYPNEGWHIRAIQEWAAAKGWVCRKDNKKPDSSRSPFFEVLCVKLPMLKKWKNESVYSLINGITSILRVPYMDSFSYTDIPAGCPDECSHAFWECTRCPDEIMLCTHPFPGARSRALGIRGNLYPQRYCYACGQLVSREMPSLEDSVHVLCDTCRQDREEKAAASQTQKAAEQVAQQPPPPRTAELLTVPTEEAEEDTITI